jgi:adenine deaminase
MESNSRKLLTRMIHAGTGEGPADLVIRNVRLLDVISRSISETDVAIVADRIVGTHARYDGVESIKVVDVLRFQALSTVTCTWRRPL